LTVDERLKKEIDLSLPENEKDTEAEAISTILDIVYKAKNPIILADACSIRHRVVPELHELLAKLEIPGFVTPMGKGSIDETNPHYGGVYIGEISLPDVKTAVEGSDCILSIGALLSDFNTVSPSLISSHLRARSVIILESQGQLNSILLGHRCDMQLTRALG
jgi:pyruvate decarboxylase